MRKFTLGKLAELAQGRLLSYIYRLTLDYDLTQELCQQTLLKMVENIGQLRQADRFWFWLFRTATGQVQHHFRNVRKEEKVRVAALNKQHWEQGLNEALDLDMDQAERAELTKHVAECITQMRLSYRNILILRCFERMPYSQIAEFMDCKELGARVMFYRAKHALRQHLSRRGITKTALGAGLYLFGLFTTHGKGAAVTVSASTLEVGLAANCVGLLGTKLGLAFLSLIGTILVGISLQKLIICLVIFVAIMVTASVMYLFMEG